jgi:hypothetical protein
MTGFRELDFIGGLIVTRVFGDCASAGERAVTGSFENTFEPHCGQTRIVVITSFPQLWQNL